MSNTERSPVPDRVARAAAWLVGVALAVYGVHGLWGPHAAAVVSGGLLLWSARVRS